MLCQKLKNAVIQKYNNSEMLFPDILRIENLSLWEHKHVRWKNMFTHIFNYYSSNELRLWNNNWPYVCLLLKWQWFLEWMTFTAKMRHPNLDRDREMKYFSEVIALKGLTRGVRLMLNEMFLTATWIRYLSEALAKVGFKEDVELNLAWSDMSKEWLSYFCQMLRQVWFKRNLKINLRESWIDDEWMKLICDTLEEIGFVEGLEINFSGNPITENWMNHFVSVLDKIWLKRWVKLKFSSLNFDAFTPSWPEINRGSKLLLALEKVGLQEDVEIDVSLNYFEGIWPKMLEFLRKKPLKSWVVITYSLWENQNHQETRKILEAELSSQGYDIKKVLGL